MDHRVAGVDVGLDWSTESTVIANPKEAVYLPGVITMADYGFPHCGQVFTPNGRVDVAASESDQRNKDIERKEIAALQAGAQQAFLYVKAPERSLTERLGNAHYLDPEYRFKITTWLGTILAQGSNCYIGARVYSGFGYNTYRRSVDCVIFGRRYVGWYYESSGDYCRLKLSKQQQKGKR